MTPQDASHREGAINRRSERSADEGDTHPEPLMTNGVGRDSGVGAQIDPARVSQQPCKTPDERRRLPHGAFRVDQHPLGPRVFFFGARVHDWHLGAAMIAGLGLGAFLGFVHDTFPAFLAAAAGVWLIAKDWRDLTTRRRDTAAWRLGLHRRPHPLRTFRRADPLPSLAAVAASVIAAADLLSALTPNTRWRGHLLLQVEAVQELRVFHALAIPVAAALFITSYYLYRRRLRAVRLAVILLLALGVFNLLKGFDFEEALGDLGVAALLWVGRGSFYVEHEPLGRRSALLRAPMVALGCLVSAYALVLAAAPHRSLTIIARETADLLLWEKGPLTFRDELARLDLAVGILGVGALVVVAYLVFRPLAAPRDLPDREVRELAGELVRAHGSDTLAYSNLRRDKHYLFTADRRAFLGYRSEGGVVIVSGEPVGPDEAIPELLATLGAFAERRGLRVAAMGVGARTRPYFEQLGLRSFYIGDEAIVDTKTFSLEGRAIRKVRQSASRLEGAGYSCSLAVPADLSDLEYVEASTAAERWLGGKAERGFSMALDPPLRDDNETLLLLARDTNEELRGLIHFVPTFGRSGASLSAMRRDDGAPNGLTEYMLVNAIQLLAARGVEDLSLNVAAFARLLHSPEGPLEFLVGRLLVRADAFFQIERLYRFNAKFNPRWEARYLMHEGGLNLPRSAIAALWVEGQLPRPRLTPQPSRRRRHTRMRT
jgi:lysyl-tRNA synthetase, class II